ncbi:heat shock protein 27-like [Condylostylus longicornis]|uniref:heat shock protein 27-like n=1 Tax=Condylostylus longicornis TaxID=2530218 RepID=UPI00244E3BF4|nr:heat shock protein 27-like [Condylostylus longicornis]
MSLLPLLFDYYEPWHSRHPLRRQPELDLLDAVDLYPSIPEILSIMPRHRNELRRSGGRNDLPAPTVGKDGFKVLMDVKQFKPEEITVKTVDNQVIVEGKHEEREDEHGHIYRHFTRKYILPKGYDSKEVTSTLSSDGVLTIKAPPPQKQIEGNERVIEIQSVGPAKVGTNGEEEPMQVENGK